MSGSCTVGLCGPDPGRMDYCSQVGFSKTKSKTKNQKLRQIDKDTDPGRMDYCSQVGFLQLIVLLLIIWSNTVNISGDRSDGEFNLLRITFPFHVGFQTRRWVTYFLQDSCPGLSVLSVLISMLYSISMLDVHLWMYAPYTCPVCMYRI